MRWSRLRVSHASPASQAVDRLFICESHLLCTGPCELADDKAEGVPLLVVDPSVHPVKATELTSLLGRTKNKASNIKAQHGAVNE